MLRGGKWCRFWAISRIINGALFWPQIKTKRNTGLLIHEQSDFGLHCLPIMVNHFNAFYIFLTEYNMSSGSLLQLRPRRSRSTTPLVPNGDILGTTPQRSYDLLGTDLESTPVDATARRPVDASFKNDDKVSPMLAKLRMTPGTVICHFNMSFINSVLNTFHFQPNIFYF